MPAIEPPILHTDRLLLRGPDADDVAALLSIYGDPAVARFLSEPAWTDPARAERWLQRAQAGHAEGRALQLMIVPADGATAIGTCVLFQFHDQSRRAEIGYALGRPHQGRGYMHEALRALVAYAFDTLDLRRLEADIDPRNVASARSLERLGFTREGHLRERWEVAGEVSDTDLYGLLRHEWRPSV
jgi:RimJ/RimL family protein N-acetyltransferase